MPVYLKEIKIVGMKSLQAFLAFIDDGFFRSISIYRNRSAFQICRLCVEAPLISPPAKSKLGQQLILIAGYIFERLAYDFFTFAKTIYRCCVHRGHATFISSPNGTGGFSFF